MNFCRIHNVVSTTIALTIGLAVLISSLTLCAAGAGGEIGKPAWRVGDWWRVKCPLMAQKEGEKAVKIGERTVSLQVREKNQLRGADCYVLQIDMMDDFPPESRFTMLAYYTVNDLKLMRLEKRTADKDARLLSAENASAGQPIAAITERGTIPLLLPTFPISPGRTAVPFRTEYTDKDTLDRASKGENVTTSMSIEQGAEVMTTDKGLGVESGALKVQFRETTSHSLSGNEERVLMEQVWIPGRPWWSSVRVYRSPDEAWEYVTSC